MKLKNNKIYRVEKTNYKNEWFDYGNLTGADIKKVIGTATYDSELEMWFTPKSSIAYVITEIN